ncbi:MAG: methionyl-tRNA formyltransferase [Armatimonadetes bacterium]|nr:methionyl-tRNA formyltransferase [Armatimonadota bacterium]
MRVVFMGTPHFSLPTMKALYDAGHDLALVVTAPDKPAGRGHKLQQPPVKQLAISLGLNVFQPEDANETGSIQRIRDVKPDVIVVVAFGQILSSECLSIPPLGCINLHASLLPKYRGAAPIQHALLNGDRVTGVTTMFMVERMDAGDIILQEEVEISDDDTAGTLSEKLSHVGAKLMVKTLELLSMGKAPRIPQDDSKATYAPKVTRDMARIDWSKDAEVVRNQVRAFNPHPGAWTTWSGYVVKIWMAKVSKEFGTVENFYPGQVVSSEGGLVVATGNGLLEILELQLEGRSRLSAAEWVRGTRIKVGDVFGG